jgi:hypothetical protein
MPRNLTRPEQIAAILVELHLEEPSGPRDHDEVWRGRPCLPHQ